jgi:hypothetical protein
MSYQDNMDNFRLEEASNSQREALLLAFPSKNTPNYIRSLDQDVKKLFDKEKNKKLRKDDAICWMLRGFYLFAYLF